MVHQIYGIQARSLILRHKVRTLHDENSEVQPEQVGDYNEENHNILSFKRLMACACLLFIAMGLGSILSSWIEALELTFPSYIGAMLVAAIIRNIHDFTGKELVEKDNQQKNSISYALFWGCLLTLLFFT